MNKKQKWLCAIISLLLVAPVIIFGLYWAWKYYGLPEWPDRKEYKIIEERAESALAFARRQT